ncbi:TPA: hypothetical protein ACMUVE_004627, partial [Enterobacter cloacae]
PAPGWREHPDLWFAGYAFLIQVSQDSSFLPLEFLIHNNRTIMEYKIHSGEQNSYLRRQSHFRQENV